MKKFMIPIVFLFIACTNNQDDWIVLFNGDDISHWREYNKTEFPFDGWAIENGILKTIVGGNRVDIITRELYKDLNSSWSGKLLLLVIVVYSISPQKKEIIFGKQLLRCRF